MNFQPTESADELVAWSDSALVIDNFSLGYRLAVVVERFEWNTRQDLGLYGIYPRFEELTPGSFQGLDRCGCQSSEDVHGVAEAFSFASGARRAEESGFVMYESGVSISPASGGDPHLAGRQPRPASDPFRGLAPRRIPGRCAPSVSYMQMQEPFARIDTAGNLLTRFAISLAGDWAGRRVSDLLPRF